eukprot:TRINITY_DN202_c0_g2_i1.p1 TRINITY_DN202_c0_g2~~TRINITY_DN202_c0_g2_i1.p1  ORF type:complete len:207 (-),score=43.09 TRINITY_DN202_c0_g2_i1:599-1219(-)
MDAEFWTSCFAAARRHTALQADQYFCLDDLDGDSRVDFLCPYCYIELDIVSLCNHLEEEHSCEPTIAACPICAANVGTDIFGHITSQHFHLFKTQRRRGINARTRSNSSGNNKRRLQTVGEDSLCLGNRTANEAPDPLISSFISVLPIAEPPQATKEDTVIDISADDSSGNPVTFSANDPVLNEEGARQAEFVQQLMLSVILPEDL